MTLLSSRPGSRTVPDPGHVRRPGHTESRRWARADAWVRTVAASAFWSGLMLVTLWWATGGGLTDLGGWQTGLTGLGRLTGLVAAFLLLVQVLLIARLPLVERAFGQDRLLAQHRLVGFTSFTLMLIHIVLITWGYAAGRLADTPRMLLRLTVDYPGMLLAAAGTLCLVLVVGSSIAIARRRLRYESWHLLHLYAYLGVGLALPHQLWTGRDFLASPASTVFWWGLWGAAAVSILVWRVAVPATRSLRLGLRVTSVVPEGDGVFSVYMAGRNLHLLNLHAGQFFQWRFLNREGWSRANPFSLSAAPDGDSLRISVKAIGDGTHRLSRLRPGTRVLVEGPYGRLSARARSRARVTMIGAGVGIAPLRALAEGLHYAPGEAVLLHRFTDEPLFVDELKALHRDRGLRVWWLPGHRRSDSSWLSHHAGTADDLTALRHWVPDIAEHDVYICGPEVWTASVKGTVLAAGVPAEHIHIENFGW